MDFVMIVDVGKKTDLSTVHPKVSAELMEILEGHMLVALNDRGAPSRGT